MVGAVVWLWVPLHGHPVGPLHGPYQVLVAWPLVVWPPVPLHGHEQGIGPLHGPLVVDSLKYCSVGPLHGPLLVVVDSLK